MCCGRIKVMNENALDQLIRSVRRRAYVPHAELSVQAVSSRLSVQLFIFISIILTVYIEIIIYSILPFQWIKSADCQPPKCTKVLLVADPQLIGSQISGHDLLNFLAKWDSDRYIRRTFLQAFYYLQPDVIVFLGDLMNEGHISSDKEFFEDLQRFYDVFQFSSMMSNMPKIFLPGDNDIGGIDDIMLPQVVHRFNRVFNQSNGALVLDNIEFYKINVMTYEIQEPNYIDITDTDSIKIALSHVPLLPNPSPFLQRVVKKIRPKVIFSGHAHLSSHFIASESDIWKRKFTYILPNDTTGKTYNLYSGLIHEIVVPTCSYRMGMKNMGYGAAFIDAEKKLLHYSVLWLPRRFLELSIYLVLALIYIFLFLFFVFLRILKRIARLVFQIFPKKNRYSLLP